MFDAREGGETETVGSWEIGLQPGSTYLSVAYAVGGRCSYTS